RKPDVAEYATQVGRELLPAAGVRAVELQIHHGFAAAFVAAQLLHRLELAFVVARDADDGVEQPMDGQLLGGDRVGNGVDQKRHVVVDDADAHPAVTRLTPGGFNGERELAPLPAHGNL